VRRREVISALGAADLAARHALPAIYHARQIVDTGGLAIADEVVE
jgi:hypothetical protein